MTSESRCVLSYTTSIFARLNVAFALHGQEEVLQESRNMIPDCRKRLEAAYSELDSLVVRPPQYRPAQ